MVPTNVLHAFAGRLNRFRFCSFPEYSADYDVAQHVVGAENHDVRRTIAYKSARLRMQAGTFNFYFSFDLSLKKYSFVSFATAPDSANSAMKFGMAIRPLNVSAMSHTTSSDATAPITITTMNAT